jgi:hypothetical protein
MLRAREPQDSRAQRIEPRTPRRSCPGAGLDRQRFLDCLSCEADNWQKAMSRRPARSSNSHRFRRPAIIVSTLALTAMLAWPIAGSAGRVDTFAPCRNAHPRARTQPPGQLWAVSHLRVSRISCARAAAAVRAGVFDLVPAGPHFHTPGFRCTSPIGPPRPGAAARPFSCRRSQQRFTFIGPGSR